MNIPICWICKSRHANSGEHIIKKSDLRFLYKNVSQEHPIKPRYDGIQKNNIRSINSNEFKFEKVICRECNDSNTQPYDYSWGLLSEYLSKNWTTILSNDGIQLSNVFTRDLEVELINVQLFLVKLLGCKLKASNAPINTDSFSKALRDSAEHPDIYFSVRASGQNPKDNYAANSNIEQATSKTGNIQYLHWFYVVGQFAIDVIHTETPNEINLNGALKPSEMSTFLNLSKLTYKQFP